MRSVARLLQCIIIIILGVFAMATLQAGGTQPAQPMQGPDFAMNKVAGWSQAPGAPGQLLLADGSRWMLDPHRPDFAIQAHFITDAQRTGEELLVSGNRSTGRIDRVAPTRKLAAARVENASDGRVSVFFHGPPSIYYLRPDRPGAAQAADLLRRSAQSGAFFDSPDLLVGIDTVNSEVILVRPLAPAAATPAR